MGSGAMFLLLIHISRPDTYFFYVDKNGNFTNIPTKEEMLKTVKQEIKKLPFLYYGTKKELEKQKIKPVAV